MTTRKIAVSSVLLLTLLSTIALAQDGVSSLADRLIELRGNVEALQDDIESKQRDHRNRMSASAQRRAALDTEVQSKELQLRQLRQSIEEQREKNRKANESAAAITPTVREVAASLLTHIDRSLPFKASERRNSVETLLAKVERGDVSAPQGLNRLWSLYEDEFRMTRENGLFQQEIEIDGKKQLSDVIRLGTMMMFFRTTGGVFGSTERNGNSFAYKPAAGESAKQIKTLFAAFEKQVRSGFFDVPNALPGPL